jgi:hypothetical protein
MPDREEADKIAERCDVRLVVSGGGKPENGKTCCCWMTFHEHGIIYLSSSMGQQSRISRPGLFDVSFSENEKHGGDCLPKMSGQ